MDEDDEGDRTITDGRWPEMSSTIRLRGELNSELPPLADCSSLETSEAAAWIALDNIEDVCTELEFDEPSEGLYL